jgi:curved DNA-binding protein CbpA
MAVHPLDERRRTAGRCGAGGRTKAADHATTPRQRLDFGGESGYLIEQMSSRPLQSPYDVLHVPRDASAGQIQRAYRELALRYHPDVNRGRDARARFQELSDAYEVLRDPALRARYDRSTTEPIARPRRDRVRAPTFTAPRAQRDVPRFLDEDPADGASSKPASAGFGAAGRDPRRPA